MQYRGQFVSDPEIITDIFDSSLYIEQLKEYVTVDGKRLQHKFFQDLREIALGLSTDGFAPFRR